MFVNHYFLLSCHFRPLKHWISRMSKRHCPEVHEPSPGKRPRQIGSPGDYPPISEKLDKPQERSYTPPRQCQTECSAECCTKEWRSKPLVIPEVASRLGVHKRPYSPPLSKSDSYHHHPHPHPSDEELTERAKQHYYHHQQRSVSSTETPLSVPVPRPPSQPTMEPPKKGHTLVHMDSRIESSKIPTSRCSQQDESDSTRYHRHHTPSNDHVSSSPEREWVQRWPKSAKWLELSKYLDNFVLLVSQVSPIVMVWEVASSSPISTNALVKIECASNSPIRQGTHC